MGGIKFSIIVAVAPDRTPEVIEWLKKQDYPEDRYEIIIKKGPNTSENRNSGVNEAKGKIIAFVDDDAIVENDWLKKAEDFFQEYPEIDVVGGPQLTPYDDTAFGYVSGVALASILGGASIRNRYRKGMLNLNSDERELTTANVFCKKEVFTKAVFNSNFWPGEDPVFFNELVAKRVKLAYYPELYIYHRRRSSIPSLAKQIFNYACVRPSIGSTRKTKKTSFFFIVPSLFVLYLVLLPFLAGWNLLFLLPLALYIAIILAVSSIILVKETSHKKALLLLPFVFLIIHISYGIGFIWGILKQFRKRQKVPTGEIKWKSR